MPLTPEAKSKLSATVRALRAQLIADLGEAARSEYLLELPAATAGLPEARARRRARLDAWVDERARATGAKGMRYVEERDRVLAQAVKEAAATLLNRLVVLRLMEATPSSDGRPLRRLAVVGGGWNSKAYQRFRDCAGPLIDAGGDATEGYATLLRLVFEDLSVDLPGLFGEVGIGDLIPVRPATLRAAIAALDDPALDSAWDDDTTLGWVYQYWNDPEREALDLKIKDGGKIEPHEIASKTQMFTERYMVEWLLHNSLGPTWLAICRKNGWTAEAEAIFPALETRRADWRERRAKGEVALDALMPLHGELEERWKYYVLQDIPAEAVAAAPASIRDLKLLDPACGSGHFLVIAFGLLAALYREEARHRGEIWSDEEIARGIVETTLCDLGAGAFTEIGGEVVTVAMVAFRRGRPNGDEKLIALRMGAFGSQDGEAYSEKIAAIRSQMYRFTVPLADLATVGGSPIIYWWGQEFRERYSAADKFGVWAPGRQGLATADDPRFLRRPWEISASQVTKSRSNFAIAHTMKWAPFVKGAEGKWWIEPIDDVIFWQHNGLCLKTSVEVSYSSYTKRIVGEKWYGLIGVAFPRMGRTFFARAHRFASVISEKGSSVYDINPASVTCMLNSERARFILESLNPGIGFEVGDVNRLPVFPIESAESIYARLDEAFSEHEAGRENSVEFRSPRPSCWTYAQAWAQAAVDRPEGAPLPDWQPVHEPPSAFAHVSYALGVALGRFGAGGEGILDLAPADALPAGILFISAAGRSSLDYPGCHPLVDAWAEHGSALGGGDLADWLSRGFFPRHKAMYDNRPIVLPLSSAKRGFVALVAIHRWADDTLKVLLADHLIPERRLVEGALGDLLQSKASGDAKARGRAEKQYAEMAGWLEELDAFIATVEQIAERGPPPAADRDPAREADSPFRLDLDDGVMINSAALWPLLLPQWKDPKKWWGELARGEDKKHYDWSHLAARYWPARVDGRCRQDPSLAVAHGRFWRYHPAKAYAWELRLQDEIGPDFEITEADSDFHRQAFLDGRPLEAEEICRKEAARRRKKAERAGEPTTKEEGADDQIEMDI